MDLYVNMKEAYVRDGVLGPFDRYCLWVSGCPRNCKGCISPESHDMYSGKKYDTHTLAWEIILSRVEGITISGGEPLMQAEALCELLNTVKNHRDLGVIIYTGYLFEELPALPHGNELAKLCDLIIDGPYVQKLDDGKALRGSSNQKVIAITDRYEKYLSLYGADHRSVQINSNDPTEIKYIGIPTNSKYKGDL